MTKKRIRYSELGAPPAPAVVPTPAAPAAVPTPAAPAVVPMPAAPAPVRAVAPAQPVARTPRVSAPIDLARALSAAQDAERRQAMEAQQAERAANPDVLPAPTRAELADLLVFRIGTERFAVDLLGVEEVIDLPAIHHVPEMPPAMLGVVNVRGVLTPVFTPHVALGISTGERGALLVFRQDTARVGILIDDVDDAVAVDLRHLRETPEGAGHDGVVLGVVRHDGALIAIVDIDALIAACRSAALLETA